MEQVTRNENLPAQVPSERTFGRYFMDKIFPTLLTSAVTGLFLVIAMYFRINAVAERVFAIETTYARQDVLSVDLSSIKSDITEMKQDTKDTNKKVDLILERVK